MASAKPGVHVVQLKPISVPQHMQDGAKFIKWDDDSGQATPVTLRVDKKGFFLYWTDQNKETEFLEISSIRDTRTTKFAKTPKRIKQQEPDSRLQLLVNMGSQDVPLEDKTLTVVYGSDFVNVNYLNFSCDRREIAKEWADELLKMAYNLLSMNASATLFLEKAHAKLTLQTDKDGKIPVKNVTKMFAQSREDKKRIEKALEAIGLPTAKTDVINPSKFTFEDFLNFYKQLTVRSEVEKIFEELCSVGGSGKRKSYMTVEQLVDFLNHTQRDERLNEILYPYVTAARAREIINQYEPNKSNSQKGHMTIEGFLRYLMSGDNAIVAPEKFDLNEDMDQPLAHYFINSSHNTYLTGHQLMGQSSVEIYRQCLLAGCRCVELDCWNGRTSEEEPIITHGYTVVTEVSFKEVIEAIAESAFKTSDYPVILSFENHCSPKQQAKMAMYCRKYFNEHLLSDPLPSSPLAQGHALPSPNTCLRKIIIKNKKKHYHHRGGAHQNDRKVSSGPSAASAVAAAATAIAGGDAAKAAAVALVTADPTPSAGPRLVKSNSRDSQGEPVNGTTSDIGVAAPNGDLDDSESDSISDDEDDVIAADETVRKETGDKETGTAGKETEAGAELSALVNYIQPVHFHSFEVSEKRNRSYEVSSFVETTATNLLKERPVDFVNYNKRQLSRVYPRGTRVDSSNYMPQVFWNAGCQLVALNFQTLDLAMQLNLGIFEYNGRSGFLLKPDFMRRHDRRFDPFAESTVDGIIAGTVSVKVISGQFLSDKRISTYVEVESYGLPADTVRKRFKTRLVPNNAINPVYDEEPFVFKKIVLPELCVIRIAVYEENGKLIGHRVLPLVGLRPGYRHIQLRNESGQPLTLPSVFVYINVRDYIPDQFSELAWALANPIKYQSELEKRALQLSALTDEFEEESDGPKKLKPERTPTPVDIVPRRASLKPPGSDDGSLSVGSGSGQVDGIRDGVKEGWGDRSEGSSLPLAHTVSAPTTGNAVTNRNDEPFSRGRSLSTKAKKPVTQEGSVDIAGVEIPQALLIADTLEKIRDSKTVQALMLRLEKDLQQLKKKHEKDRVKKEEFLQQEEEKLKSPISKTPSKTFRLRKYSVTSAFSRSGENQALFYDTSSQKKADPGQEVLDHESKLQDLQRTHSLTMSSLQEEFLRAELEVKEKYNDPIYNAIEKAMLLCQAQQVRSLETFHQNEKEEIKKRLEEQTKKEIKSLQTRCTDKNERARMKREIHQRHIDQAVMELKKFDDMYENKRKEVERQHLEIKKKFEDERQKSREKLQQYYNEQCAKAREEQSRSGDRSHMSGGREVTAL